MKLRIVDDLTPEDVAMLQALYSRSAESVDVHLEKVKQTGSGKFMSTYYVGYGHKSIADCGSTTMFIEDVSLLAAKAIQDWPLYSGQETSTRYINMSQQRIHDPINSPDSQEIIAHWMSFYETKQKRVAEHVRVTHPRREGENEESYERAVKARTFDILRGFLPAGITTQLSWHTNLRQAGDHLAWLREHPAIEVRDLARSLAHTLHSSYASSGFDKALKGDQLDWMMQVANGLTYPIVANDEYDGASTPMHVNFNIHYPSCYDRLLAKRPRGCPLPHFMTDFGQTKFEFGLDFGSYRDLQRHRNGVVRMPLLNTELGFEPWYLEQLDNETRAEAEQLIATQIERIRSRLIVGGTKNFAANAVDKQYITALGFRVPCLVTMALPALLYFLELRTQKTVHPTLRTKALQMAKLFKEAWPDIALHIDTDSDDWTVRRGAQTITQRA